MSTTHGTGRRYDPERRRRIVEAGLRVVAERGISGLTFRAVADAADVPLGSTTYHFADKDELLEAVVELSRERNREFTERTLRDGVERLGLLGGICNLVEELTVRQHRLLVLEHDLFLSALRHPRLREQSRQWSHDFVDTVSEYTGPATAETLGLLFDGICLQSALFDVMFFASDVEPHLRVVLGAAADAPVDGRRR
ncbi:TetR/AcrR family transcriptional regulator [Agromyces bracchium]|uniref:TetR family transcriptional regulator n=1 Tax=Agromyces bracchium TaxID=88376 RepID=A0A6I3M7W8_9MICO|nr:TetR family transcriptional regulator [Agromyces bracchium]MTH69434.1 TetR family transcriptional regulator [Agromyces bracchium]